MLNTGNGQPPTRDSLSARPHLLGQCAVNPGETIVDHAEACGITLPTNCTSGTCGTCMVSLILGEAAARRTPARP